MTLQPNEVKTEHIANQAVTTPKIADEAVTSAKLKDGAVKTEKIATGAITGSKIGEGQIYGSKLRDGAVRAEKIAAGAVTTSKIGELQVTSSRLQVGAVTTEKIQTGAVTTEKIANASVTPAKLSFTPPSVARPITPAVVSSELGVGSVTEEKIADGAVTPVKLSFTPVARPLNPPLDTAEIGDGKVTPAKLSFVPLARPLVPAVETAEIAVGAVSTDRLADNAVTPPKMPGYGRLPGSISGLRMQTVVLMGPFRRVAISIAEIVVENIRLSGISLEANLGNSGAGGLDTGVPAADTWYYLYIITNNDGSLVNSLISVSATTPNLPTGYTKKRRIGAARAVIPALPSFLPFTQIDNTVLYTDAFEVNRLVNAGGAIIFTAISASAYIPPTARRGRFYLAVIGSSVNAGDYVGLAIRHPDMLNASGQFIITQQTQVATKSVTTTGVGDCDTDGTQGIYYSLKLTGPAVASAYIDVVGFYDSL